MRYADKMMARFVIILGEDELKKGAVMLKDMQDSSQRNVSIESLIAELKS
jgi:histidyl-tRNA synthetase